MLSHSGHAAERRVPDNFLLTTNTHLGTPGERWAPHTHAEHMLIWSDRGSINVHTADRHWVLPPGLGLWIPAGQRHEVLASTQSQYCCTYFAPEGCEITWPEPVTIGVSRALHELLLHLAATGMEPEKRLRAQRVGIDLIHAVGIPNLAVPRPSDPRILPLSTAILANPADDRSLDEWALELNLSVRTLARAFSEDINMTFSQWRLLVRVRAAIALLSLGEPVGLVGRRVGYHTVSAFGAAFRRVTGHSPGGYFRDGRPAMAPVLSDPR